jgi:geranylgeranyl reductase family protein
MTALACDVLVVGAGPAGSAIAAALARAGHETLLVEARRPPRAKTCAEYASPRVAEELERLEAPDWRSVAVPLQGMHVIRGTTRVPITYRDRSGARAAWGIDRVAFDAMLAGHAVSRGAVLLERTRLSAVEHRDGRVSGATLDGPEGPVHVRCAWLIGADGARSRVARSLGVERPLLGPRRLGLVARYEGGDELQDHGEMHVGRNHYVGLAPTPGGQLNVGMALPLDVPGTAEQRFAAAIAALPAVRERLRGLRRLTSIRGASPIGHRVARSAGPGWLLVGDAAGFVDPFTGEGIYRALRSARLGAEALADDWTRADDRYRHARRGAFAAKDALTWLVQGLLAAPPLLGYALSRLESRPGSAAVLGSALGDCRPASDALAPRFLAEVLRP